MVDDPMKSDGFGAVHSVREGRRRVALALATGSIGVTDSRAGGVFRRLMAKGRHACVTTGTRNGGGCLQAARATDHDRRARVWHINAKVTKPDTRMERDPHEHAARVRLGSYEFGKKGVSRFDMRDPYHLAVALTWPQFLATLLAIYLVVNVVFAALFWLIPGCVAHARPYSFGDAFFFSIETLATVGYGEMYPATLYGHVIAAIEIAGGLGFTAIVTGLTFVRFSRPRAKLVFAANPVVAMHDGTPTLMLRVGNGRLAVLLDAVAKLNVLLSVTSAEGKIFRRAQELRLERTHLPAFPLTWTLMHVLDEQSPLHGYDKARAIEARAQLFVTLEARDPTLASIVHEIRNYAPQDICFGMRYADAVILAEDGTPVADLTKIGALEPDVGEHPEPGWTERE